jgi:hypothetical protein
MVAYPLGDGTGCSYYSRFKPREPSKAGSNITPRFKEARIMHNNNSASANCNCFDCQARRLQAVGGTKDGKGAADNDEPYTYHKPTVSAHFPFSEQQFANLLSLRAAIVNGERC